MASESRRQALSERLGRTTATSRAGTRDRAATSAAGLAREFAPSKHRSSPRDSGLGRNTAKPRALPGESRRNRLEQRGRDTGRANSMRIDAARSQSAEAKAQRISHARRQSKAQAKSDAKTVRRMRQQYKQAAQKDEKLKQRMQNASRAAALASDVALRGAISATPVGSSFGGHGTDGGYGDDGHGYDNHHDDGYYYGSHYWHNWYWHSYYPYWNSWFFGFGWGYGFGYGLGYGGYDPYYSYGYSYHHYWPTYAYYTPSVIYNVYEAEQPVTREVIVQGSTPQLQPLASPPQQVAAAPSPDFSLRAASEYMGLGDRAFAEARYGDAVHYYAKAIQFAPEDGVLYLVLSDSLFATGDYHYAAFALRRALVFNPELASLGLDKRTFYGDPEDFDQQLDLLARFVADHPLETDARLVLAANYLFAVQPELAIGTLDQAPAGTLGESDAGRHLLAASAELLAK